jgi:hypothetical protein
MKFILSLALIILAVFFFKDDIYDFITGAKKMPYAVEKYNAQILGEEFFAQNQNEAVELKGVCAQFSPWRQNKLAENFAQNCVKAESYSLQ